MSTGSTQLRPGMTSYGTSDGGPRFLSDVIIELGLVDEQHVNRAVQDARLSRANVGQILVQEGRLTEDDLARALAARYGLSHIDLTEFDVDPEAANLLPPAAAQRYRAVPLTFEPDGGLLVAMADPSDSLALSDITFMTHLDVRAAVAAANLIEELAARLPLAPKESGGAGLPVTQADATPAPDPEPAAEIAVEEPAPAEPAAPALDTAELDRLRAELEAANSELDVARDERNVARGELDAARGELDAARGELDAARGEQHSTRSELNDARVELEAAHAQRDGARAELDAAQSRLDATCSELDAARTELDAVRADSQMSRDELEDARSELEDARSELEDARSEIDQTRDELHRVREELEATRDERDVVWADLERAKSEAEANSDAAERAAEAEERLAEMSDLEPRVTEAHSIAESMRNDFELEREGYAVAERDLRAKLASEAERHEALREIHADLQQRMEQLGEQHAALLRAYSAARKSSAELVRCAHELTSTLARVGLDEAAEHSDPEQ